jgi:YHS domain-containing protein
MKIPLKLVAIYILLFSNSLLAQPTGSHINKDKNNIGIQGYDPVSYFNDNEPSEGTEEFITTYKGVNYKFKNQSNKNSFLFNPSQYQPKYGGWCAYAMGIEGSKVKIDPETYKILDGGLYLFYNFRFTNTLPKWNEDENNLKTKADAFWRKLVK